MSPSGTCVFSRLMKTSGCGTRFLRAAGMGAVRGREPLCGSGELFESVGVFEIELGHRGSAQRFQVGATAEFPSHLVCDRTHVRSGGYASAETGTVDVDSENDKLFNFDLNRLEND